MKKLLIVFSSLSVLGLAACGPVQSPECAQYISCQTAIDTDRGTTLAADLEGAYGETGTCWSTTPEAAQICTDACSNALDTLSTSYPEIQECQPAAEG